MHKSPTLLGLERRLAFNEHWDRRIRRVSIWFVATVLPLLIALLVIHTTGLKPIVSTFWHTAFAANWDVFALRCVIALELIVCSVAPMLMIASENFRKGTQNLRTTAGYVMIAELNPKPTSCG